MKTTGSALQPTSEIDKPSHWKVWLTKVIVGVLLIGLFGGGFVFHRDQVNQIDSLKHDLSSTKSQLASLKASNTKLQASNQDLSDANTKLEASLKTAMTAPSASAPACPQPQTTDNGGPLPGHVATNQYNFVTGVWLIKNIDIKVGTTVTWLMQDQGTIPKLAVQSDTDSCELFGSDDLTTSAPSYTHTFNKTGVFGWHDKYDGSKSGYTISVSK